jgi:hypothetical protein
VSVIPNFEHTIVSSSLLVTLTLLEIIPVSQDWDKRPLRRKIGVLMNDNGCVNVFVTNTSSDSDSLLSESVTGQTIESFDFLAASV